jgi:hypothetical protein
MTMSTTTRKSDGRVTRRLGGLLVCALLVSACGDGRTPSLSSLSFDGQAPDSPLVLLLSVEFEDDDGDLADGGLDTFINQKATSAGALDLLPIFLQSEVAPEATSGRLEFVLELSFNEEQQPGSSFTLGARAADGAGNTSTTQEIKLRLE